MNREAEMPNDIIEAERKISLYFAERNIKEWALGGIQNRLELPKGEYVPMSDWYKIKIAETKNGLKIELINYLESEVVRRMKEQGLI